MMGAQWGVSIVKRAVRGVEVGLGLSLRNGN